MHALTTKQLFCGKEKTEEENGKNWAALQKFHALKSIVKFTITHRVGYVSKKA